MKKDSAADGVTAADRFRERMEAQCGQIERYRVMVEHDEGRHLSMNEAALEWIEHYAPVFDCGVRIPEQ